MIAHLELHHARGWRLLDEAEYLATDVEPNAWRIEFVNLHNAHRIHVLYVAPDTARPNLTALDLRRRAERWLSEYDLGIGVPGTCNFRIDAAAVVRMLTDTGDANQALMTLLSRTPIRVQDGAQG